MNTTIISILALIIATVSLYFSLSNIVNQKIAQIHDLACDQSINIRYELVKGFMTSLAKGNKRVKLGQLMFEVSKEVDGISYLLTSSEYVLHVAEYALPSNKKPIRFVSFKKQCHV
jgi:hypothetical protein